VKITNKMGLPKAFVEMAKSDYRYKDKQYSVTSLLKGTREAVLQRRYHHEIEEDVADMIWMLWGQAVHHILEQQQEEDCELKEEYLKVPISHGYTISGLFDLYNHKQQKITDYKTASVWKVVHEDFEDWRKQLLIYAWMMRKTGFEATQGEVVALLKDHSKSKAEREKGYPQHPVYRKTWKFTEQDFLDIEEWLFHKFEEIQESEWLPDDQLPLCSPEERWAEPDKYAVMKKGRKSALRVLDTEEEARKWMEKNGKGEWIEHREGTDKKCANYCRVNQFCSYYQEKYGEEKEVKAG